MGTHRGSVAAGAIVALGLMFPATASAQAMVETHRFVTFSPVALSESPGQAPRLSRVAVEGSLLWSRCDYRGEGMLAGLAVGGGLGALHGDPVKHVALRAGFGMVAGWALGRLTGKSACREPTAASAARGA